MRMIDGVVDDMGDKEMIARQSRIDSHRIGIKLLLICADDAIETIILKFKIRDAGLKVFIYVAQGEIRRDIICGTVDS